MTSNKRGQRKRIVFRFDFDHTTGGGHLQRCLSLAKVARDQLWEPWFLAKGDENLLRKLIGEFDFIALPPNLEMESELSHWQSQLDPSSVEAFFFDISHPRTYARLSELPKYAAQLRAHSISTAAIDGMMPDSILRTGQNPLVDFVITPYVGAEEIKGSFRHLFGPEYFVLRPEMKAFRQPDRAMPRQAQKILISLGRSDPDSATLALLAAITQPAKATREITVVVGDLFSAELRAQLQSRAANLPGVKLMLNPSDISAPLAEADLALVGAGLTKYELAFVGTPGIFFSSNEMMHDINRRFAKYGSGIAMGPMEKLSAESISLELDELAADREARETMARTGLGLIDGQGADRILRAVVGQYK